MSLNHGKQSAVDFAECVRENRRKLNDGIKSQSDFIVSGSGSTRSVVEGRLSENPDVSVLAGRRQRRVPSVTEAACGLKTEASAIELCGST